MVARLGILGVDLYATIARVLPPVRIVAGVLIVSATPGVLDTRDGELRAGDVSTSSTASRPGCPICAPPRRGQAGNSVVLHVERGGELLYVTFVAD